MSVRDLWLAWNKFWFAAGSPIPMALFRIAIGFLVLVFYWWISPEATTFFGTNPIVAPATVERWMGSPQLDVLSFHSRGYSASGARRIRNLVRQRMAASLANG